MFFKTALTVAAVAIALTGCNAARGLGQDVENLGLLMQGKKVQKKEQVQEEVIVSDVVSTQPGTATHAPAASGAEAVPLPQGGTVEVYPYPYPKDSATQQEYPAPVPPK